jgi:hypothetical protein
VIRIPIRGLIYTSCRCYPHLWLFYFCHLVLAQKVSRIISGYANLTSLSKFKVDKRPGLIDNNNQLRRY